MGTGAVAFNLAPQQAVLCDSNPHLVNFYSSMANGDITPEVVRDYLVREGEKLLSQGEEHYYFIRERFNSHHAPLDFLFLNRAGFNGMIRFNRKGEFNIPFCRKPQRFAQAYVTKIVNQVDYFNGWDDSHEKQLYEKLSSFAISSPEIRLLLHESCRFLRFEKSCRRLKIPRHFCRANLKSAACIFAP